jgi:hypothetical protein
MAINVKGHTGLLSVYDDTASEYKPVVCITSTSVSKTAEIIEKVNYCTEGVPTAKVDTISREVSVEAEVMDDVATAQSSYDDIDVLMEAKEAATFKLEGRGEPKYFDGVITALSDSFTAGEDATFSFTLRVDQPFADVDPNSGV